MRKSRFVHAQSVQLIIFLSHQTSRLPFPLHHGSNGQKVDAKRLPHNTRMALALQGPTLIFDGICNLCNGSMGWFQERVRKEDSPVWYSEFSFHQSYVASPKCLHCTGIGAAIVIPYSHDIYL